MKEYFKKLLNARSLKAGIKKFSTRGKLSSYRPPSKRAMEFMIGRGIAQISRSCEECSASSLLVRINSFKWQTGECRILTTVWSESDRKSRKQTLNRAARKSVLSAHD